MAITVIGVQNALPADMLPIGYTLPVVTAFADWQYRYDVVITIGYGDAQTTAIETMQEFVTASQSQISSIIAADFLSTATVTAYGVLTDVSTRHTPSNNNTSMEYLLSGTVEQYLLSVTIFVKAL